MMAHSPAAIARWETVLRHSGLSHPLRLAALAASVSTLLLAGCVTNKPAIETLTEGVAGDEAEVPATAASLVDPAAAATKTGSAQSANPGGAAQQMAAAPGQATAPPPAAPMVGGDGSSVVMEGTGLKAMSSSIFSVGQPAAGIAPGASGPAGGSLFRSQPQPMPPAQAAPLPLTPQAAPVSLPVQQPAAPQVGMPQQGAALKQKTAPELAAAADPALSLVGLFAGARKTAAKGKGNDPKALELAANLSPQQVAVLSYGALPGIRARSMFATVDDEAADHDDRSPRIKLASLTGLARLAPNGLIVQTETVETGCFKPDLLQILKGVESRFGRKLIVTSGHRSLAHNVAVGGATRSHHLTCEAADIQVPGVSKWELASYLRSVPGRGGVGTYCHTESVHVDTGRQRDWNWPCRTRDA